MTTIIKKHGKTLERIITIAAILGMVASIHLFIILPSIQSELYDIYGYLIRINIGFGLILAIIWAYAKISLYCDQVYKAICSSKKKYNVVVINQNKAFRRRDEVLEFIMNEEI